MNMKRAKAKSSLTNRRNKSENLKLKSSKLKRMKTHSTPCMKMKEKKAKIILKNKRNKSENLKIKSLT